jgi:RNA recognition motif-containing protein
MVALRKDGLRGQAWIIMDDVQAATAALQAENGVSFFGRDLVIQYAKETSDRIAKRDGTYVPKAKRKKLESTTPTPDTSALPSSTTATTTSVSAPPSHMLLTQNLPETVTMEMLKILFHPYAGYKDVRLPRPGLAFIEFESEPHATLALQALNGFQLTATERLQLDYGKV